MSRVRVRQIYFKDNQLWFTMNQTKDFVPFHNPKANYFLESGVIRRLFEKGDWIDSSYYGVVSHKFFSKIKKSSDFVLRKIEEDGYKSDVYSFFNSNPKVNVVKQAEQWHDGFIDIYKIINSRMDWGLNFDDSNLLLEPIFSNHWIAKREVFEDYCEHFLIPVMNLMDENKLLRELCFKDSNYISNQKASPEQCGKIFGKPYYTFHPFILERLFPIFCHIQDINVKHI